jgi:flagellar hook-length control protein FliK
MQLAATNSLIPSVALSQPAQGGEVLLPGGDEWHTLAEGLPGGDSLAEANFEACLLLCCCQAATQPPVAESVPSIDLTLQSLSVDFTASPGGLHGSLKLLALDLHMTGGMALADPSSAALGPCHLGPGTTPAMFTSGASQPAAGLLPPVITAVASDTVAPVPASTPEGLTSSVGSILLPDRPVETGALPQVTPSDLRAVGPMSQPDAARRPEIIEPARATPQAPVRTTQATDSTAPADSDVLPDGAAGLSTDRIARPENSTTLLARALHRGAAAGEPATLGGHREFDLRLRLALRSDGEGRDIGGLARRELAPAPGTAGHAHGVDSARSRGTETEPRTVAEQILNALHAEIDVARRDGQTTVDVRLDPPELGSIRIHLSADDRTVTARLVVQDEAARVALAGQAEHLRQTLAEAGVHLRNFDVRHDNAGDQRQGWSRPPVDLPEPSRPPKARGRLDAPTGPPAATVGVNVLV